MRLGGAWLFASSGCTSSASLHRWPSKPVRVVVPFGAGNSADLAARLFASVLAERWRQAVVVDNRAGGDGTAGVQAYVAERDDHALLFAPMGVITTNPLLHAHIPFDPSRDVVPIAAAVRPTIGIAATAALARESLTALATLVRERPGAILWSATPGLPELVFRGFLALEDLDMRHVPYRDISQAIRDLDAGRLHLMIAAAPSLAPVLTSGHARLLAVTTSQRNPVWPDVPTAREAGYPGLAVDGPFGFFGWRDMPEDLRHRIAGDVRDAAADETLTARLEKVGFVVETGTPEAFAHAVDEQRRQAEALVRLVGRAEPGKDAR